MTRIAVTGHTDLPPHTTGLVADGLRAVLADAVPLVGLTCLAPGADQIFADQAAALAVLDAADLLVAVWDGVASDSQGGTAATVAAARDRGLPVTVVWPAGAQRHGRRG